MVVGKTKRSVELEEVSRSVLSVKFPCHSLLLSQP